MFYEFTESNRHCDKEHEEVFFAGQKCWLCGGSGESFEGANWFLNNLRPATMQIAAAACVACARCKPPRMVRVDNGKREPFYAALYDPCVGCFDCKAFIAQQTPVVPECPKLSSPA